jgi:predicted ArsR family transcriptional regulator
LAAIGALDDPSRRALYDLVAGSPTPVSRDDAARATGLSRGTAAFHLDRLAADGLLSVEFRRLTGRTGPGSGRPAKLYRRAADEISVSLPERRYDLAADLLAEAVDRAEARGEPVSAVLPDVAREAGHALGERVGSFDRALQECGFEPRGDAEGGFELANCPFHRLVDRHTSLVCGLNLALLEGVLGGAGESRFAVRLDPAPGRCCVRAVAAG